MSREEIRVDGLAEPISHYTDAVRAGGFSSSPGSWRSTREGRLVGGDDVVAQARQVFENMRAVLGAARLRLRGRRQGDGLSHGRRRPAAHQPRAAGRSSATSRPASTLVEVSRLAVPGAKVEIEAVARRAMNADPYNAFITRVEPGSGGDGPLAGRTLAVKDLFDTAGIRTTYGSGIYADHVPERNATAVQRLLDAGAVDRRQGAPARVRMGRARAERVVRDVPQPDRIRARRPAGRRRARRRPLPPVSVTSRSARTRAARSACPRPPARSSGSSRSGG